MIYRRRAHDVSFWLDSKGIAPKRKKNISTVEGRKEGRSEKMRE